MLIYDDDGLFNLILFVFKCWDFGFAYKYITETSD